MLVVFLTLTLYTSSSTDIAVRYAESACTKRQMLVDVVPVYSTRALGSVTRIGRDMCANWKMWLFRQPMA